MSNQNSSCPYVNLIGKLMDLTEHFNTHQLKTYSFSQFLTKITTINHINFLLSMNPRNSQSFNISVTDQFKKLVQLEVYMPGLQVIIIVGAT